MASLQSPYVLSVVNVLLAAAVVTEKGLQQDVIDEEYVLSQ